MFFPKGYYRFVEITIAGFDCSISDLALNLLYPSLFLLIFYLFLLNIQYYPDGMQNLCEMIYESCYNFLLGQVGHKAQWCVNHLMALMFFIILLNLSNLFPWSYGATSQLVVNFSLALIVFVFVLIMGFKQYGVRIWRHFIMDVPLVMKPFIFVLELLSFLIRPIVLAVRLTINVLVGHLILHIISSAPLDFVGGQFIALVFSVGFSIFEVLVCFLQAYIFVMLACIYIAEMSAGH